MPAAAPRPCLAPGCGEMGKAGSWCVQHAAQEQARRQALDTERGSAAKRGYGGAWRKARQHFLRAHPLCEACRTDGVLQVATDVDHIVPHRGDWTLFWRRANWQSLCHPCHSRKTASEDGGFGRGKQPR